MTSPESSDCVALRGIHFLNARTNPEFDGMIQQVYSPTTMTIFSFLFGLAVGSFLNVCIYRLPLNRSIVHPPSHCPRCEKKLRLYDNIPVLSYILLRGKCRFCSEPISIRYPTVELIAGLLSMALFIRCGLSIQYVLLFAFSATLVIISFIDLQHQIIPDILSIPGIVCGFVLSLLLTHITWLDSLIGIFCGGGILFLIAVVFERLTGKEGMGGGDVKLLAMIGAWMGWRSLPFVILISSLVGALIGGGSLLLSGKGLRVRIPFGPFLAIAALVYLFYGQEITIWYYRLLL
jgi:leader peptidase (prepilin peptidase)/N-methyltransferase